MYGTSAHTNRSETCMGLMSTQAGRIIYHNVYIQDVEVRLCIQLTTLYLIKQSAQC